MRYPPENDLMVRAVLTPKALDERRNSLLVLRVRAKNYIASASVHLSSDNQSYLHVSDSLPHVTGGRLLEPMTSLRDTLKDGPVIQAIGPDIGTLRVLSDADWEVGRQMVLIDNEWCFVRQVRAVGGDRFQLLGLLKGQLGSATKAHAHGAEVFLADSRMLQPLRDGSVRPGSRIWVKTQPAGSKTLPLPLCAARSFELPVASQSLVGRDETPEESRGRYRLAGVPVRGTLQLFRNGLLLRSGGDYQLDKQGAIVLKSPLENGWLRAWYTPQED